MAKSSRPNPTPMPCPTCGEILVGEPGGMRDGVTIEPRTTEQVLVGHMEAHRPTRACEHRDSHPDRTVDAPRWVLDLDEVRHPRPDRSCWVCHPCGYFSPVESREDGHGKVY